MVSLFFAPSFHYLQLFWYFLIIFYLALCLFDIDGYYHWYKMFFSFLYLPNTKVGQLSILEVNPFKNIWCKNNTVSLLRKIEFTSSCEHGGFFELAAILNGLKKHDTRTSICSIYSSSASTIRKTKLKWKIFI